MEISSDFSDNDKIPSKYTCDGEDVMPQLVVSGIPSHAKTLAIIVDDPDAPSKTWVHWVIFDIPASPPEMKIKDSSLGKEGMNDFNKVGYNGPCPPSGIHHYHFKVYALGAELALSRGATREEVDAGMKGKILAEAELVGVYQK